jgi:hypothetical protein
LGLFGGGLDSRLAFRMMRDRFDGVEGVHFATGFVRPTHRAQALAARERGEIDVVDVAQRYLDEVVTAPRHGYGSGMNPCHDCRAFMLSRAAEIAGERGIGLLFTGDVIGQRAHDQSHAAFRLVDREAGVEGRVLRPLSARHLAPVAPDAPAGELQGRSRRGQLELAEAWNETGFPTPSGRCCRLADPAVARRVRDWLDHRAPGRADAGEIPALFAGRHFRLGWDLKVVLSRNEEDARQLETSMPRDRGRAGPVDVAGPAAWIESGVLGDAAAADVAGLVASYTAAARSGPIDVRIESAGRQRVVRAGPVGRDTLARWRI